MRQAVRSSKASDSLRNVSEELRGLDRVRDAAVQRAFSVLEEQHAAIAHLVIQSIGDRQRAARWMCMHQRAFGGRSAYDLLAEGDVDTVCDRLTANMPVPTIASQRDAAY
ncbi:MbcA/ParS/Xre antitoxin family protein [Frateuria terrea]|uniref:Antitoxin Xre/MbcA/ParS-like toxin-binding domain-containing protein n=1 Tax=Frateuria terrea TaxID=529704 RepID=A0A1H6UBE4_9GAMM|nr:antitoxin Xre/MbcA/ParS toxin-binding domain-containing protein [Frateuria terrea]SEI89631.1 Protein of unknown function [Frateuria terrea]SFP37043.1 Protein of unknown function [Frateuria terrea]